MSTDGQPPRDDLDDTKAESEEPRKKDTGSGSNPREKPEDRLESEISSGKDNAESPLEEASSSSASYYDDPYSEEYERGDEVENNALTRSDTPPPPSSSPDDDDDWDSDDDGMVRMSFLEHLEELRDRIIQSVVGLVAAYLVCLVFAKQLFIYVRKPIQRSFDLLDEIHGFDPPLYLVALTPQEQFHLIYLKVPLLGAVFVAAPWLVYQVWGFIAPGLYQRERRWAKPFIFCIAGLFILGGLFGYFVVLKFALTFLLGIGIDSDIRPMISVSSYFSTFVLIELGLGIVFQMPVLIFFLTLLRIVDPTFLLGNIRYVILGIFVIAAVVTPTPDVFNMILFAAPMILLFYVGIGASFLLVAKRKRGRIPWLRIMLVALLIIVGVAAIALYFMHSQLGYEFINQFPWIVTPHE
jgi:sec-independent protein translocase protein TatC